MKRWLSGIAVAALAALLSACAGVRPGAGIIPAPLRCEAGWGRFTIDGATEIRACSEAALRPAQFLKDGLKERVGLDLKVAGFDAVQPPRKRTITLQAEPIAAANPEAYELEITRKAVVVRARGEAGLFYGVQSMLQMADAMNPMADAMSATFASVRLPDSIRLPAVRIADEPRFQYRGLMLDESRHFFGKAAVKQTLDSMAYLKMNRFHWHLTDSQGWRVEIKKYPRLTEVGGRGRGVVKGAPTFYTQEDIRELVAYAAARHIMIVPEIDMPGHATAATKSYPEISGGDDPKRPGFTFNPAKEETYAFLTDVLAELAELFPGPYINLGGDEVFFGNAAWKTDPQILKFTREQGLRDELDLEHYFVRRMAAAVNNMGRLTMGWDDIGAAGIPPHGSVLLWWHHEKPQVLTRSVKDGFPVVLCPRDPCYFDFIQYPGLEVGRKEYGGKAVTNTLESVYNFPDRWTKALVPRDCEKRVLGVEACLWSETIPSVMRLQYLLYPRLAALAEDGWTQPERKDYADFESRAKVFMNYLAARGIYYFNLFDPAQTPEPKGPGKEPGDED